MMKSWRRLLRYVYPYTGWFAFSLISMIIVSLCVVAFTSLVMPIFDQVLTPSTTEVSAPYKYNLLSILNKYTGLYKYLQLSRETIFYEIPVVIFILFVIKGIFSYSSTYYMSYVGQSIVTDLRNELYSSIQYKPLCFFRERTTGTLISRVVSDMERIQSAASEKLVDLLREGLTLLSLAAYLFYLDWRLAVMSFVVAPVVIYPLVKFGKKLRKTSTSSQKRMADISTLLHESITGNRIVKAFGMEGFEIKKFVQATRKLLSVNLKATKFTSITPPIMEIIGSIGIGLMIWYGGRQIHLGQLTTGQFCTFLAALYGLYAPIKKLSRVHNTMQQAMAAADRAFEILDLPGDIIEDPRGITLTDIKKGIEFKNVSFSYDTAMVLDNISFFINSGQMIAIVGASGAGKTTLVNLLPRFYDASEGSIYIDGKDIRSLTLKSLRAQIGIVTQESILFNDTVKNNISYGNPGIKTEELEKAALAAYAHDFIQQMPLGYDTIIGEQGLKLSGGQRQRIAIARAILKNPPLLILDEATSSLDSEAEIIVQNALANLMKDRTTVVIAHRLSTARKADKIIVIDQGKIVGMGKHDELYSQNEVYTRLYDLQFKIT
jgi:subfamily B ATP-binding cassette protein MsbA